MSADPLAPEQQEDSVTAFVADLAALRGDITYDTIKAAGPHYSRSTYWRVATGPLLCSWDVTKAFITSCLRIHNSRSDSARAETALAADLVQWEQRWRRLASPALLRSAPAASSAAAVNSEPIPMALRSGAADVVQSLERLRCWSGLSGRELARRSGLGKTTVSDKLSGRSPLTGDQLYKLVFACVAHRRPGDAKRVAAIYARLLQPGFGSPCPDTPDPETSTPPTEPAAISTALEISKSQGDSKLLDSYYLPLSPKSPKSMPRWTRRGFAAELHRLLELNGMTVRRTAVAAGVSTGTVSGWFAGNAVPSPSLEREFLRVLEVLGVSDDREYAQWIEAARRIRTIQFGYAGKPRLRDPYDPCHSVVQLREAGWLDLAQAVAERAVAAISLDNPDAVKQLLEVLREAGWLDLARTLAERAIPAIPLDNPYIVKQLLEVLREAGWLDLARTLAERAIPASRATAGAGRHRSLSLAEVYPKLMEEWHPDRNTPLTPNDVQPGSVRSVWWRCAEGHEWSTPIKYRVRGTTCPTCRSRRRGH
ncbi:hypothetical protein IU486_31260 [Streptomyces gardneri]|uniref:zinc-ribbon domain-containing protein n=1 Tax=Nocardia abscessus TaxID=120957 RepID=UPI001895F7BE|nr:zinc-ribbon domain-containing protein [Nocardia abscessus]MBF6169182.1 hypothetical protein [Streptomyces gardneri]MBF6475266.1 hypothetical protein [Nocardia abscessus]